MKNFDEMVVRANNGDQMAQRDIERALGYPDGTY